MDIGSLRVSLGMDSAEFVAGANRAVTANTRLRGDITALEGASRSFAMRGVAQQFSQVAQSAMATGNPIQALAIQLPDIAGMMGGPLAIGIGVAAGALLPLAANFLSASDSAENAEGAVDAFSAALARAKEDAALAGQSVTDLAEIYGSAAERIREEARYAAQASMQEAVRSLEGIIEPLQGGFNESISALADLQSAEQRLADARAAREADPQFGPTSQDIQTLIEQTEAFEGALNDALHPLGLTRENVAAITVAFNEFRGADSMEDVAREAGEALAVIREFYPEGARLPGVLGEAVTLLTRISREGAAATDTFGDMEEAAAPLEDRIAAMRDRVAEIAGTDLAGLFETAWETVDRLVNRLSEGRSFLRGWGSAIGDFVAGYAPSVAGYVGQIGTTQGDQMERLVAATTELADQLGVSAKDLLTVMSYETGGTFNPAQLGPTTQWGQHIGLIQMGEPQRTEFGYDPNGQVEDQMEAVGRYLVDAGVKAGDSLLRIYAAVNAGDPDLINASDENNGGAPGTVLDKVNDQMAGHLANAEALLTAHSGTVHEVTERLVADDRARLEAEREAEQERDRIAREAEAVAQRELGYREDLIAASQRATQDAEFELSLQGKSADCIAQERAEYILLNQAREAGIDLSERIAGSTQTYGEMIEATSIAVGQAAAEQERLDAATRSAAEAAEEARAAQERLAAEMAAFVSSLTNMALGPITDNPIGGFLSTLPGFQTGAESVIGGFVSGGFGGATSALTTALSGATSGLAGLGTAIGAIAGPVGAAIGLFNALKGSTEVLETGLGVAVKGHDQITAWTWQIEETTRLFGLSKSTSTNVSDAPDALTQALDKAFGEISGNILDLAAAAGIGAEAFEDFRFRMLLDTTGMDEDQVQQAVIEKMQKASDAMARMAGATGRWIEEGETATQALERMVATFDVVQAGYDQLGFAQLKTGEASVQLAAKMAEAAGGMDELASSFDFYFSNFYSTAEQAAEAQEAFDEAWAGLHITRTLDDMEEFREEVERLQSVGKDEKAAGLIALSDDFANMLDLMAQATEETGEAARDAADIASEREDLERRLLEAQGDQAELDRRWIASLDESNQALGEQVLLLEKQAELQAQRNSLDEQWYQLTEQEWKLRKMQLDGMDESLHDAQLSVWLMEDWKDVQAERYQLDTQLLELQEDEAALRARELEELSPLNRARQEEIWRLEDAKEALDALTGSDYASLFDFQKAQGLAAAPANVNATLEASNERIWRELAGMRAETRQLQVQMEASLYRIAQLAQKSDKIGTPPVRAA